MIISNDAEKAFDKMQHAFMLKKKKTLKKEEIKPDKRHLQSKL